MKQVTVTFNYDPELDQVTDVKCSIDGVATKKQTTKKVKDVVKTESSVATITREDNKIVLSPKAVELLGVEYEDRLTLSFKPFNKVNHPVISKSEYQGDENSGNKLTKTNTVGCRGKANVVLAEYGTVFTLEATSETGIFRMVGDKTPQEKQAKVEVQKIADEVIEEIGFDIVIDGDDSYDIDEIPGFGI